MSLGAKHSVALTVQDRRLLVAEATAAPGGVVMGKSTEVVFAAGRSLEEPVALGGALRQALADAGITAHTAVAAVSCRDVLSLTKVFPPAGADVVAQMARMEAQRGFVTELDQLTVDCADSLIAQADCPHLVAAVKKSVVDALQQACRAAGLKLTVLTVGTAALSRLACEDRPAQAVALVFDRSMEVVLRRHGRLRLLRHVPLRGTTGEATWTESIVSALQRVRLAVPELAQEGSLPLTVCMAAEVAASERDALGGRLSPSWTCTMSTPSELGLTAADESADVNERVPGLAAAAVAAGRKPLSLNFLASKLTVRKRHGNRRRVGWAVAVAAILVLCVVAIVWDLHARRVEIERMQAKLETMRPEVDRARMLVQQATTARHWTDRRPKFLEPIREVSETLPRQAPLWMTSLAMREDRRVVLTGKAADEKTVLEFLDLLREQPELAGAKLMYMRVSGDSRSEVAFSMMFDTR